MCRFKDVVHEWCPNPPQREFWQKLGSLNEGAVIALLQCNSSARQLCTVATHLHWNPAFPDVKAAQAAILCHQVRSMCGAGSNLNP